LSEDGFERQSATNHLGHFLLTLELLPLLEQGKPSRVVAATSGGHTVAPSDVGIPFEKLSDPALYDAVTCYTISKLANMWVCHGAAQVGAARARAPLRRDAAHAGAGQGALATGIDYQLPAR
jgi:NAD(P)-dependent dehydrogenase (short-subunit alcohol dehydrogenase family)